MNWRISDGCKGRFKNPQKWRSKFPNFLVSVISRMLRSVSPFSAVGRGALERAAVLWMRLCSGMRSVCAQTVASPFDLNDDGVVEEPVEECGGDDGIAEDLTSFREAAVGCEDHGTFLVTCVDQLEEQVGAALPSAPSFRSRACDHHACALSDPLRGRSGRASSSSSANPLGPAGGAAADSQSADVRWKAPSASPAVRRPQVWLFHVDTHVPSGPMAQTWKLLFARSIASMLIILVIGVPSFRFQWNHHGI
jgi:hypothetical protein